jgi:hypothetical protein
MFVEIFPPSEESSTENTHEQARQGSLRHIEGTPLEPKVVYESFEGTRMIGRLFIQWRWLREQELPVSSSPSDTSFVDLPRPRATRGPFSTSFRTESDLLCSDQFRVYQIQLIHRAT